MAQLITKKELKFDALHIEEYEQSLKHAYLRVFYEALDSLNSYDHDLLKVVAAIQEKDESHGIAITAASVVLLTQQIIDLNEAIDLAMEIRQEIK